MEGTWFPILTDQINDDAFKKLTPSEKLYFWTVLSEFNAVGEKFYKSDMWFAAFLKLSLEKIRKGRAKLAKLGLIDVIPGTQDKRGQKLATTYLNVKWSEIPEGERFIQIDRTTFYRLIDYVRSGKLHHEDVVAYVYITYFIKRIMGRHEGSVLKSEFKELSDMPQATTYIARLHNNFKFTSGESLFAYNEQYRAMYFSKLHTVAFNKEHIETREAAIQQAIKKMRNDQGIKKIRADSKEITEEDLPPLFRRLYEHLYGEACPLPTLVRVKQLQKLGEPSIVADALEKYFMFEHRPKTKKHSLQWFIDNANTFMVGSTR